MTGLNTAISTALSGLDAFSKGIGTVGNNIANQTSSGYAVRSVDPQTAESGSNQAGSGVVDPALVQRAADSFQAAGVYSATATNSAAQSLSAALSAIDQAFTGNGDVQGTASTFFTDLNTLASDPTNAAQVGTVLADAQGMVGAFTSAAGALGQQTNQISTQVTQQVDQVNTLLGQLGTINKQLQATPGQSSLLDQQQAALTKLSTYMAIQTIPIGDTGAIAVMTGGTVLVDQSGAQTVNVNQSQNGEQPTLSAGAGQLPLHLSSTGGSLGGLLSGLTFAVNATKRLDWFAGTTAGLVNQTQAEGLNGSGALGQALFNIPSPTVTPSSGNTGSATLTPTITNQSALPSNGQGYVLTYSASGWTATVPGTKDSYSLGAGSPLTLNGMNIAVTGTPNPGDTFQIAPEPGAASSISLSTTSTNALAVADPYTAIAGTISTSGSVSNTNAGTISESTDIVTATPAAGAAVVPATSFGNNLEVQFTSASAYNVVDTSTGNTVSTGTFSGGSTEIAIGYPAGGPSAGNFWQVKLTGSPAAGDVATLAGGGLNSGSNAQRMANLWTASDQSLPGGSLQGSILSIIGSTGAAASQANTLASNTTTNLSTAESNLNQVAGVNQDQQATLLTAYQQDYQAAAKVISTASTMFQSLIQVV